MVGTKLINLLKEEAEKYIDIPYLYGGKDTRKEIKKNFSEYKELKKNKKGIDCSGLAFHLLDFYSQLTFKKSIADDLIGTDGKKGVRRLSANLLTSQPNSFPITSISDIQTGDLIRLNSGKHILFVLEKTKNHILYIHSSNKTKTRGVHFGEIKINDYDKSLEYQNWNEVTPDNKNYSAYFCPKNGDGIFRLFLFKQL